MSDPETEPSSVRLGSSYIIISHPQSSIAAPRSTIGSAGHAKDTVMPYDNVHFDDLAQQFNDKDYRLAALEVHDEMRLAAASITKLFGSNEVTPERVLAVLSLTSARYARLQKLDERATTHVL